MPGTENKDQIFFLYATYVNPVHHFELGYLVNLALMVIIYDVMTLLSIKVCYVSNLKLLQ